MSLTLNMVGGGGGGLSATDALLRVQAPAGSTVTISKGTTTKTDLGHENADDHSVYDYYFIIHASQFDSVNPWTVTASLAGEDDVTDTIIIDAADEYNLVMKFGLYIYNRGVVSSAAGSLVVGKNDGVTPTRTANADNYYMKGVGTGYYGANGTTVSDNLIDVTNYTKLCAVFSTFTKTSGNAFAQIGVATAKANSFSPIWQGIPTPNETVSVDISTISGTRYVGFGGGGNTNQTWEFNIIKLWLEP